MVIRGSYVRDRLHDYRAQYVPRFFLNLDVYRENGKMNRNNNDNEGSYACPTADLLNVEMIVQLTFRGRRYIFKILQLFLE